MRFKTIFASTAALAVAGPVFAAGVDEEKPKQGPSFEAEFSAGAEYDSNVSVNDVDTNTGSDDFAAVIDADFEATIPAGLRTEIEIGYGFSQSLHADFTAFDLQSHLATAEVSHDFKVVEVGAAYRFAYSRLGGDPFMTMHQVNPYAAASLGEMVYVRGGYTWSDRDFDADPLRDSKRRAYGGDVYLFLNGVKSYVAAGYQRERDNAVGDEFDYQSDNFSVRFSQRFDFAGEDAKLSLGWRREDRDYEAITPSIAAIRADTRDRFQAELEIPISSRAFVRAEFEHGDYDSNLPAANYKQDVAGLRLGLRL